MPVRRQRTLKAPIGCVGIGLHSGAKVTMRLKPAEIDTGITFVRVDRPEQAPLPARYDLVSGTTMCTALGGEGTARVSTIEHLMAALAACEIDNAIVEVDGPELPIMDGSAAPFMLLIDCAGSVAQAAARRYIEILKPVTVNASGKLARLEPCDAGFELDCTIEFAHPLVGIQHREAVMSRTLFRRELARARTFGFADAVEDLRARGLALGGSLKNAVVVGRDRILNEEGLRFADEFVRHKMVDAVGDLYLAGAPLRARYVGECAGHALHNRLLRALFSQPSAWRWSNGRPGSDRSTLSRGHATPMPVDRPAIAAMAHA